ncbi:LptA/OstA family protein, partial [Brucella melitensis]|uniref:LptA/OstA family protein n=1 Tax=Brucella melitensis TaxID=29459 RepID=UPI0023EA4E9D
ASWAQQAADGAGPGLKLSNSKDPGKLDADKLEMRDKEGVAVFTGNVAVSPGDALLKAGQMTVYYSKAKKRAEAPEPANAGVGGIGAASIEHIDIAGKVYLKS